MDKRPCVAFDLTRLFLGPLQLTPRGIDRVELGYADYFLKEWPGNALATLPTPLGTRIISREHAIRIVENVQRNWGEMDDANDESLIGLVKHSLRDGAAQTYIRMRRPPAGHTLTALARLARKLGCMFGPSAESEIPRGALYLNTGQVGLAVPQFLSWLARRPDIKPVFMLHDVIPIDNAEYVSPASRYFHGNMLESVAAHASGLIVTTRSAGAAVCRELAKRGRHDIPVIAEPLPVAPQFTRAPSLDGEFSSVPYFVVLGSIEPRKNHLLLLNVWRELVRLEGSRAPKLVIAGSRWRGHRATSGLIENSRFLQKHVIEVTGLPTPSLHRLLSNARGLLMPSFAEGFGLPIIEAQALGIPVIASNIPAHREAGGEAATYLSPTDTQGWVNEIYAHLHPRMVRAQEGRRIRTWPEYLNRIEPFLLALGNSSRTALSGTPALAQTEAAIA